MYLILTGALACSSESEEENLEPCLNKGTQGATSTCLKPTMPLEYYAEQSSKYFDTLDIDADPNSLPNYSELVARWEWEPWLLLTGYGRDDMILTGEALKRGDPSTVPLRECKGFDKQPFGRCYVVFEYEHGPCPIYEEFTFNDAGEMTFIEAWSNLPELLPHKNPSDRWAENESLNRLSTRVPGLGNAEGRIEPRGPWLDRAGKNDAEVADFALRATDWWTYWYDELEKADDDFFAQGCGWNK